MVTKTIKLAANFKLPATKLFTCKIIYVQVERIVISIRRELISFVTPPNTEYTFSQLAVNIIWYCRLKIAISLYKQDKIREGQIPLDEKENYKQLRSPMALETSQKAEEIIKVLHHEDHIDDMTNK